LVKKVAFRLGTVQNNNVLNYVKSQNKIATSYRQRNNKKKQKFIW